MNRARTRADLKVHIIAKNEEANIARCLDSLCRHNLRTIVLDSGSTDRTLEIAGEYSMVEVIPYEYKDHCAACNEICAPKLGGNEYMMILDADMIVSAELIEEICRMVQDGEWDVLKAPVRMHVEGKLLPRGSLCPPKAIVFKAGRTYFVPSGHGEALANDCRIAKTESALIHDDRKEYQAYLKSQVRYARNLIMRARKGARSTRDTIRMNTPLMLFAVPFVSYFLKLGFLSGKPGLIYAIDRLIAEAIMFRESLSDRH